MKILKQEKAEITKSMLASVAAGRTLVADDVVRFVLDDDVEELDEERLIV